MYEELAEDAPWKFRRNLFHIYNSIKGSNIFVKQQMLLRNENYEIAFIEKRKSNLI